MATVKVEIKVLPDDDWTEAEVEQADGQTLHDAVKDAGYTQHFFRLKEE
jgi:sulfur carrier protein ThiS|tara:strand:- start:251 stop:397 length:147 start_codon:yes stop_codon:yes gene_type:complete